MMDQITLLAGAAFGQGRIVLMRLDDTVVPNLAPSQRTFAENLRRRIARDEILDETFQRDLDAFIAFIQRIIANGTTVSWETDEYNVHGGHEINVLDSHAEALVPILGELQAFWIVIAETLDAAKASVAASKLGWE